MKYELAERKEKLKASVGFKWELGIQSPLDYLISKTILLYFGITVKFSLVGLLEMQHKYSLFWLGQ